MELVIIGKVDNHGFCLFLSYDHLLLKCPFVYFIEVILGLQFFTVHKVSMNWTCFIMSYGSIPMLMRFTISKTERSSTNLNLFS